MKAIIVLSIILLVAIVIIFILVRELIQMTKRIDKITDIAQNAIKRYYDELDKKLEENRKKPV